MNFKVGDKVDIKEEAYIGSYKTAWFRDGRIGLTVAKAGNRDYVLYQKGTRGNSWHISGSLLEPHKTMPQDLDITTWKRNKPLMVKISVGGVDRHRHFSHTKGGNVYVYMDGKTSFTKSKNRGSQTVKAMEYRLPTKEELA